MNSDDVRNKVIGGLIVFIVTNIGVYFGKVFANPLVASVVALFFVVVLVMIPRLRQILNWIGGIAVAVIQWVFSNWQLVVGLLLLSCVAYGIIALTPTLWARVLVCCLILATVLLIRYPLKSYNDEPSPITRDVVLATPSSFECNFFNLNAWKPRSGWSPEFEEHGLKLVDHDHLRKVLLNDRLPEFVNGEIECEVYLKEGALFNVMLGDISNDFYMARLDTRPAYRDCFLIRPRGKGWKECNARNTLKHHSPYGQWLKMRVIADGKRISLYRDDLLVDEIDDAEVTSGTIGLFAELSDVYVRKVRVLPEPT